MSEGNSKATSETLIDQIARAVLYEGYILYPYRPSIKSRQRWTFGGLYPRSFSEAQRGSSDAWWMQTQVLLKAAPAATLSVKAPFLHLQQRTVERADSPLSPSRGDPVFTPVETLRVGDKSFHTWQEAAERSVTLSSISINDLLTHSRCESFHFDAVKSIELLHDNSGVIVGRLVREQQAIAGTVELSAEQIGEGCFRITARINNMTSFDVGGERDAALLRTMVSTHLNLTVAGGAFVSAIDPPAALRDATAACKNIGCFPVLVGNDGQTDTMLASPIILYDYPQIAPESPGDLFDGTEIDEILSLRIMTLTDDEKRQVAAVDGRAGDMLARTEALAREQMMGLHGTMRGLKPAAAPASMPDVDFPTFFTPAGEAEMAAGSASRAEWEALEKLPKVQSVRVGGRDLKPGDRVRLHPLGRADIFDLALEGMTATIAVLEQDLEGRVHVVVTIDDDPGKDFGEAGKPGHRFFFGIDEVEPIERAETGGVR